MRRCGKSYLLFNLFKEYLVNEGVAENHIIEIAFDSFENKRYRDPEVLFPYIMEKMSDERMYYVLLDEVQMLDDFESVLNSLGRKQNVDVYVTGSNAKFLSKDIITEFRGRGDEVHMYPLTFGEFMSVYDGDKQEGWRDYVLFGGIPLVLGFETADQKSDFLKSLFEETYISDITGRNNIRNKAELEELLNILSSAIGSLTNPSKLSATFKSVKNKSISKDTIIKYIDYLRDSFLIDSAIRYDIKGKKYINTPSKYYFTDLGLRNARLNFRQVEETHVMENIIFNELKVRGYNVDVGVVVMNEVDKNGKKIRKQLEVDFVCNKGSKRFYIQSAYALPDKEKMEQEQRSLVNTGDGFKKIIITKDAVAPLYNEEGILVMSVYDFLLNPDSMEI
jgi:AAA+ superfamily ATPase